VAIASFLHATHGGCDWFREMNDDRSWCHALTQFDLKRQARGEDPSEQVALSEQAKQSSLPPTADENTPNPMLAHQGHGAFNGLLGPQAQGRAWLQSGDTLHLQITSQLHDIL
jgi:hypothetical protein